MQIALCHHLSLRYIGGGEKWVINVAKELQARGHDVTVHCLPFTLKGEKNLEQPKLLGDISYTESYFHKVKADISYVTYHPFSRYSFHITGPKIAGVHSQVYSSGFNSKYGLLPSLAKVGHSLAGNSELKKFDAIHILTDAQKVSGKHVYIIPNFVDSSVYKPYNKAKEFTVAFASRKVWQKGYDVWKQIKSLLETKVKCMESGGISEVDMPLFLGSSHAVVVPSRVDTFGLSIVEAMMCGTQVLVSDSLVHHGLRVGPLVFCKKPEEYVKAILFLREKNEFEKVGAQLRSSAKLAYDKDVVMDRLEDMFLEVANCACA
jgi:glycosyltransferase involved in cell wall biosynthesis